MNSQCTCGGKNRHKRMKASRRVGDFLLNCIYWPVVLWLFLIECIPVMSFLLHLNSLTIQVNIMHVHIIVRTSTTISTINVFIEMMPCLRKHYTKHYNWHLKLNCGMANIFNKISLWILIPNNYFWRCLWQDNQRTKTQ